MPFIKSETYNFHDIDVGGYVQMPAPTLEDKRRIAKNVSVYGIRHNRGYMCRTDRKTGIMTITRLR